MLFQMAKTNNGCSKRFLGLVGSNLLNKMWKHFIQGALRPGIANKWVSSCTPTLVD